MSHFLLTQIVACIEGSDSACTDYSPPGSVAQLNPEVVFLLVVGVVVLFVVGMLVIVIIALLIALLSQRKTAHHPVNTPPASSS